MINVIFLYKDVTPEMPEQVYYRDDRDEWIKLERPTPSPKEDPSFYGIRIKINEDELICNYKALIRQSQIDNSMEPCSKKEWTNAVKEGIKKVKSII